MGRVGNRHCTVSPMAATEQNEDVTWWANFAYGEGYQRVLIDDLETLKEVLLAHGYDVPDFARIPLTRKAYKDQMRCGKGTAEWMELLQP